MTFQLSRSLKVPILMYHSISDDVSPDFRRFSVSPTTFVQQMEHLSENGFTPITCAELGSWMGTAIRKRPERPVVLTFDDAFEDFYHNALPILVDRGFHATLFIPTDYVGKTGTWLHEVGEDRRPIVGWNQLEEIRSSGIECASHGDRHIPLDRALTETVRSDVTRSKIILEDRLGSEVLSFAYPHGYLNPRVKQIVQEAGFTSAYAIRYKVSSLRDDHFALPRLIVLPSPNLSQFAKLVAGRQFLFRQSSLGLRSILWHQLRRTLPHVAQSTEGAHAGIR